jgi:lipopolysaccharide/colanic/teichoic acid biosynthesis glycosyltransferase
MSPDRAALGKLGRRSMYPFFKRLCDIVFSSFLLVFSSPVLVLVSLAIFLEDRKGVLFVQQRIGRNERPFQLIKLRSMALTHRFLSAQVYDDSPGVTVVGRFIRRYKIDELPQLINVLRGDLSIVGPRPCLPETLLLFGKERSALRHSVRPGMTGLAQVNGNIHLDWHERLEFDLAYVSSVSAGLDFCILLRTVLVVVFGEKWGWKN